MLCHPEIWMEMLWTREFQTPTIQTGTPLKQGSKKRKRLGKSGDSKRRKIVLKKFGLPTDSPLLCEKKKNDSTSSEKLSNSEISTIEAVLTLEEDDSALGLGDVESFAKNEIHDDDSNIFHMPSDSEDQPESSVTIQELQVDDQHSYSAGNGSSWPGCFEFL